MFVKTCFIENFNGVNVCLGTSSGKLTHFQFVFCFLGLSQMAEGWVHNSRFLVNP